MCAIIHFGTDGWRARVDEDFTADNVARIADAVGELWQKTNPGKTVYIGFDTRPLAREFAELAAGVLAAHGLDAVLASRPVPTPALTWAAAYDGEACGALMVTGSHHPQGYLCLKIRMGDGSTANQDVIEELEETMAPEPMGIEGQYRTADIIPDYMQAVASFVDAEAIRAAHLRVVVDPMGGAAQGYLADLLRELGVEVHEIHAGQASDQEDICPDPVEPWVDACERTVIEDGACAGLVTDGDADRIGAVDERGRYIHPHQIMALVLGDLVQFRNLGGARRRQSFVLDARASHCRGAWLPRDRQTSRFQIYSGGDEEGRRPHRRRRSRWYRHRRTYARARWNPRLSDSV